MLARAAKPNIDCLRGAAKKLVIWTFGRKEEFHSSSLYLAFDYSPNYRTNRPFRNPQRKWQMRLDEDEFYNVEKLDLANLTPCEKKFYTPHPNVLNRSESEIQDFYNKHDIQIFGKTSEKCPPPILSFDELDLPSEMHDVVRRLNYSTPTPIQSLTWPIALSGLNMVGVAQTGSGKTLGFVLPGVIHIKHQPPLKRSEGPIAVVVSPTRELAQQINKVFLPFARSCSLKTACVFGGSSKNSQSYELEDAHICVGTPGRIIDFIRSGNLNLRRCTYFVLDEADRLLDMGFEPQIKAIMNNKRPDSQVLMWSATWPKEVKHLALNYLDDYIGVKFGASELTANPNIRQHIHVCEESKKRDLLLQLLGGISQEKDNKTLVFAQTKSKVSFISRFLFSRGFKVTDLHGGKSQFQRDRALALFRSGKVQILVGTAVVGRGLDITDIKYVINYDFPNEVEDYVHLIGRTGRSENEGVAHTFFTELDARCARELVQILKQTNQEVNPELMEFDVHRDRSRFYRFPRGYRTR